MKNKIRKIIRDFWFFKRIYLNEYIKYRFAKRGNLVTFRIGGECVYIRKGTPDLKVALESLGDELSPLSELLRRDYSGIIIDAGAYIGTASLKLASYYPFSTVVSVEPSSDNFEILKKNVSEKDNISVIQAALTCRDGDYINLLDRGTGGRGYTIQKNSDDCNHLEAIENVVTISIGGIQKKFENKDIGIIKLDIEGAEKELFEECEEMLSKCPVILTELHDRIIDGCYNSYVKFSKNRWLVKTAGEKYLSLERW